VNVPSNKLQISMTAHVPPMHLDYKLEASVPTSRSFSVATFMLAACILRRFRRSWKCRLNRHYMFAFSRSPNIRLTQQQHASGFTHAFKNQAVQQHIWRHAFCNSSGIVKIHESEQTGRKVEQNLQVSNLDKHIDKFCMLPRRICGAQLYHNAVAR